MSYVTKHSLLLLAIKIRDGANNSSSLLKTFCNSDPGPSAFLSSGTQMWVEYSSTQSGNSFEASFKKRLDPSCKSFSLFRNIFFALVVTLPFCQKPV